MEPAVTWNTFKLSPYWSSSIRQQVTHVHKQVLTAGLVRAPLSTTALQVASRIFVVWTVAEMFPESVRICPGYPVMLLAWSITEVIRYTFYAWNLVDEVPYPLLWLRFDFFPVRVWSEIYNLLGLISNWCRWWSLDDRFCFETSLWFPSVVCCLHGWHPPDLYPWYLSLMSLLTKGFYTLYTHMIKQRRKVLGKKSPKEGVTQKNK